MLGEECAIRLNDSIITHLRLMVVRCLTGRTVHSAYWRMTTSPATTREKPPAMGMGTRMGLGSTGYSWCLICGKRRREALSTKPARVRVFAVSCATLAGNSPHHCLAVIAPFTSLQKFKNPNYIKSRISACQQVGRRHSLTAYRTR